MRVELKKFSIGPEKHDGKNNFIGGSISLRSVPHQRLCSSE